MECQKFHVTILLAYSPHKQTCLFGWWWESNKTWQLHASKTVVCKYTCESTLTRLSVYLSNLTSNHNESSAQHYNTRSKQAIRRWCWTEREMPIQQEWLCQMRKTCSSETCFLLINRVTSATCGPEETLIHRHTSRRHQDFPSSHLWSIVRIF